MNKVIAVNLNGNAYQLDEDGYNFLRDYLRRAESRLQASDDKREVMNDLEQAIADKCASVLRPHKNVVTAAEVLQILNEIGPVQVEGEPVQIETQPLTSADKAESRSHRRQLYRIRDGAKWSGVCTGLAAYADIDLSLVRVAVVLATIFSGLFPGLLVYIAMTFIVPMAYTPAELAEAHARPAELRRT
jgi:phage shock protein PspC (stress-responsive transcriptional regulator)